MLQLQIFGTAVAGGDDANIVTQHLDRQRMGRIANQQHAAGHLTHCNDLPDDTFITDHRLTFVNAVEAALIDDHLIGIRIGAGRDNLRHHLLLILTQRRP